MRQPNGERGTKKPTWVCMCERDINRDKECKCQGAGGKGEDRLEQKGENREKEQRPMNAATQIEK